MTWTGKMAEWVRMLALLNNSNLIPSTHTGWVIAAYIIPALGDLTSASGLLGSTHIHTYTHIIISTLSWHTTYTLF